MDKLELLEATLSRYAQPDRAAAILGDLLETAQIKGRVWFCFSFLRVLGAHAWRVPAAWLGAYVAGGSVMALMMTHDPLWSDADFRNVHPSGPIGDTALTVVAPKYIVGGPSWLEWDRFDIFAKANPTASPSDVQEMLRGLLVDRFKLVTHSDTKPQPAFILTVEQGKMKLKPGDPTAPNKCESVPQNTAPGAVPYVVVSCVNQTPALLALDMHQMAGAYVTNGVVDQTGLKGVWNFQIKWTAKALLAKAGPDGISFFDALDKTLGLRLEKVKRPVPVLVIDHVEEKPTEN